MRSWGGRGASPRASWAARWCLRRGREVLPDGQGRRVEITRRLFGQPREGYMEDDKVGADAKR